MTRPTFAAVAVVFLLPLLTGGCAHYEFDLVAPPELGRHVGTKADEVVRLDPLEYRFRAAEGRLVMNVFNPTNEPITLQAAQSYVVSPDGQSRPLRGQTIAPGTFIRLILPPMRPFYYAPGPTFGVGFGVGFSHIHSHGHHGHKGHRGHRAYGPYSPGFYDPFVDGPRYFAYYDESDAGYWEWKGESDIRLHLVYQRGTNAETFADDFTFHRKKM